MSARRLVTIATGILLALTSFAPAAPADYLQNIVTAGLTSPTAMAFAPDGRLFVCEQTGKLRVIQNGVLLPQPFLTVSPIAILEQGLLGVAFDPAFESNGWVYVYYTRTSPDRRNVIVRYTADGDTAVAGSAVTILELDPVYAYNHQGGSMHFGPDGMLYVSVGDNANGANSHDLASTHGKLLRMRSDGSAPEDNPWYGTAVDKYRTIWAVGFRNPFTFAFRRTGGALWINDVGQDRYEEISVGVAGGDYGWPHVEGPDYDPAREHPVHVYAHDDGCAITGGTFYDPPVPTFPAEAVGRYVYGEFCENEIRMVDPASPEGYTVLAPSLVDAPVDLDVGPDGNLYYVARGSSSTDGPTSGVAVRITYAAAAPPSIAAAPEDQTVAAGQTATFQVLASGAPPLSYAWERDGTPIQGAESSVYETLPVTELDDGAVFRCTVSNLVGAVVSAEATLHVTSNAAPVVTIATPEVDARYAAGDTIHFSGQADDDEDGVLAEGALTWWIDFHHDTHAHPAMPATTGLGAGTFVIPNDGETATDVWYRVSLEARDAQGRSTRIDRDVHPRLSTLTLRTEPPGLQLTLDAQPVTTPHETPTVVGMRRRVGIVSPQVLDDVDYAFTGWSNGLPPSHIVAPGDAPLELVAVFETADTSTDSSGAPGDSTDAAPPSRLALSAVQPNPVARDATVELALPAAANVRLEVVDVHGRVRVLLHDGEVSAGRHAFRWSAAALPPGVYLVSLRSAGRREWKKVVVSR